MHAADVGVFLRGIRGSIAAAAVLVAWDGALTGSYLMSMLACPIWFLFSLAKNAIRRPGWGLALARIGLPALVLWLIRANSDFQLGVAEANARRVVAACEGYRAANGRYPDKLDELVPRHLDSIPRAKYCLMGRFSYRNFGAPMLYWQVVPPYSRKIYHFETRSWGHLD